MNEADFTGYRYLIVDDDQVICALIASLMRNKGISRIQIANNTKSAARSLMSKETCPDIIISDLNMPDGDGVEFVRHLADERFTGGVILISGKEKALLGSVVRLGEAHGLNMLGALAKPFKPDALFQLISRYGQAQQFPDKTVEG